MNILGNVFIGSAYALYCSNQSDSTTLGDLVIFGDGSSADLANGILDNKSTEREMIIVPLTHGINHFKFGKENENPKTVTGVVTTINLNYPGVVQIIPSNGEETSVQENSRCFANIVDGELYISPAKITEFTYIHQVTGNVNFTSLSDSSPDGAKLPILRIYSPKNIKVTGNCRAISFIDIDELDIDSGIISGNRARLITGNTQILDCPYVTDELDIKSNGKIYFVNQLQCPKVTIKATGKVTTKKPIHTNKLTIISNGEINLNSVYSPSVKIETNGEVHVSKGYIYDLTIKTHGKVHINLSICRSATVQTNGEVNLKITSDITASNINTNGEVDINLNLATNTTVNTNGKVHIIANGYSQKPKVTTNGKVVIETRQPHT